MRYFGINDIETIELMTPREYELHLEAAQLRELDNMYSLHQAAWANLGSQQTNASGDHLKFDTFDKFFGNQYKQAVNDVKLEFNPGAAVHIAKPEEKYNMALLDELEGRLNG
ncbi:hypothetical protein [Convivina intestini]|uniref:hypothetical protein n=1 Tax=Convivina intestini TaxID=1505726 RepID=UPI00200ED481|nr:hypothetical protein [Convivina intestini]